MMPEGVTENTAKTQNQEPQFLEMLLWNNFKKKIQMETKIPEELEGAE